MNGIAVVIMPTGVYPNRKQVAAVEKNHPRYLVDVELHPTMYRWCITARSATRKNPLVA